MIFKTGDGTAGVAIAAALLAALVAAPVGPAVAQDEVDDDLAELLALLEEETEIATHTRLNADFVPGVVTVLRGDQMLALGARTVHDALALVPGIEINRDDLGNATLRPRGVDFFENSGQVKLLVNGLDFFRQAAGQNNGILLMPIEQVQRIEVIRGPGSGVHGDFAFTGLVNIITRQGDQVHVVAGNGGLKAGGAQLSIVDEATEFSLDVGVSIVRADDLESAVSSPGTREDRRFAHLVAAWGGWDLRLAAIDREALQPGAQNLREGVDEGYTAELAYGWEDEAADRRLTAWAHHGDNDQQSGGTQFFEGGRTEIGLESAVRVGRHRLLGEATWGRRDTIGVTFPPPTPGAPLGPPTRLDLDQDTASLLVQDEIDLDPVTLTIGARYDRLEDFDSRVSPRAAAVWRASDRHTLKAQYAEGFRSASAFEETVSANAMRVDLDYESIEVAEFQYIYRSPTTRVKLTVYDGTVEDLIRPISRPGPAPPPPGPPGMPPPAPAGFTNDGSISLDGVELEWSWNPTPYWYVMANASLIDTEVDAAGVINDGDASFGQPDYLANLATTVDLGRAWTLGAHLNVVGDREVTDGDQLDGYEALNFSLIYRPAAIDGLTVRALVRNATEDDVAHLQFRPPNRIRALFFEERRYQLEVLWRW